MDPPARTGGCQPPNQAASRQGKCLPPQSIQWHRTPAQRIQSQHFARKSQRIGFFNRRICGLQVLRTSGGRPRSLHPTSPLRASSPAIATRITYISLSLQRTLPRQHTATAHPRPKRARFSQRKKAAAAVACVDKLTSKGANFCCTSAIAYYAKKPERKEWGVWRMSTSSCSFLDPDVIDEKQRSGNATQRE